MSKVRLGINGFGRIGRLVCRIALERSDIEVVAINNPFIDIEYLAYLFKYDSVHGKYEKSIVVENDELIIDNNRIKIYSEPDPINIPWKDHNVDVVCESSGFFTTTELANKHIAGGSKKVVISAPPKDSTPMYVMGVNHLNYLNENVISNASCTTNALAPIVKVINDNFGFIEGLMTTIHAATSNQQVVDATSKGGKDWRAGRSTLNNVIPASTGAAKACGKVLPEVEGKLTGMAFRVPTADVSVIDLTCRIKNKITKDELVKVLKNAAETDMKGIIGYTDEKVVSTDFIHKSESSIFDIEASIMLNESYMKIVSWYDNEWGYSNRLVDMCVYISTQKKTPPPLPLTPTPTPPTSPRI